MIAPGKTSVRVFVASAATAALAMASLAVSSPPPAEASASPGPTYAQAGVTYVGYPLPGLVQYSSPPAAGRVEVTVSADGRSISRFSVTDAVFAADTPCAGITYSYTVNGPIPITNPQDRLLLFSTMSSSVPQANPLEIDGSIDPGRMIGRFSFDDPTSNCTSFGNVGWVASAPGGCLGSPEHVQLQDQYDALTKKIAKLTKKAKRARKADKHKRAKKLRRKAGKATYRRYLLNQSLTTVCNQ